MEIRDWRPGHSKTNFKLNFGLYRLLPMHFVSKNALCALQRATFFTVRGGVGVWARLPGRCGQLIEVCRRTSGQSMDCTGTTLNIHCILKLLKWYFLEDSIGYFGLEIRLDTAGNPRKATNAICRLQHLLMWGSSSCSRAFLPYSVVFTNLQTHRCTVKRQTQKGPASSFWTTKRN